MSVFCICTRAVCIVFNLEHIASLFCRCVFGLYLSNYSNVILVYMLYLSISAVEILLHSYNLARLQVLLFVILLVILIVCFSSSTSTCNCNIGTGACNCNIWH